MKLEELKLNNIYKVKLINDNDTWYISFRGFSENTLDVNSSLCKDSNRIDYINPSSGFFYIEEIEDILDSTEEEKMMYLKIIEDYEKF